MSKAKKITVCPHCGSEEGFYTTLDYIDVPYMRGFNGEEKNNIEMFDNAKIKEHRYAYCIDCGEKIGSAEQLLKQIKEAGAII